MTGRKQHWEDVYANRSPLKVSWYQDEPAISLHSIQNCGLGHDDPIIDCGGGSSVLVDHLLDHGYEDVTVLDISPQSLAFAQKRLADRAEQVHWLEGDILGVTLPRQYALWHDRALFHFLTEPLERTRYIEALQKSLRAGGYLVLATFSVGGPQQCSGLDIVQYDFKCWVKDSSFWTRRGSAISHHLTLSNCLPIFDY